MANPLGIQNIVGNWVTAQDLMNSATTSFPAAAGSGLPTTYVPGALTLSAAATSNTYAVPIGETLVALVQLASGTATMFLNTGSAATGLTQVASTGSVSGTNMTVLFYQTPVNAITSASTSSTVPTPGAPTSPYFNVSFATTGCQIQNLAVLTLGNFVDGADWVSVRSGINACANQVLNTNDASYVVGQGSGAFSISA